MTLKKTALSKVAILFLSFIAYILIFFLQSSYSTKQVAIVAIIPVIAAGLLYGFRGGLFSGLLVFPLNIIMYAQVLNETIVTVISTYAFGRILGQAGLILIGVVVGRMRDLGQIADEAIRKHQESERKLNEANANLENIVKARTDALRKSNEDLLTEINEHKRAEQAIQKSSNLLDELQKIANIGGWEYDFRTDTVIWSNELYRIFGYEPGEIIPSLDLFFNTHVHPDDRSLIKDIYGSKEVETIPEGLQYRIITKNGSMRYVAARNRYEYDASGVMVRLYGMVADITERKKSDEMRLRLISAIEQTSETIMFMDADGTILYINPAVTQILGYAPEKVIGINPFFTKNGIYSSDFYQGVWETISGGSVWKGVFKNKKVDGTIIELDAVITPIRDAGGSITGFVSISRDTTKERQLEEQLLQSQKMEAIGTLAGGIAHDFNNILGAIIGYTELAQIYAVTDSRIKHNLDLVLKASDRAKELIRQILAFSRKADSDRKPVQLHTIIHETLKLLRPSIPTTIEIRHTITQCNDTVIADSTQIHQVIMNLCTNSAQSMQEAGGVLELHLTPVSLDTEDIKAHPSLQPGPYIQISVSDTGVGIDAKDIQHIFEPFFTTKGVGKGTGMGLAVAHGIVKNHGGDIKAYSEPGRGTIFHVLLPSSGGLMTEPGETARPIPFGTEKILFVDDEEMLLSLGKEMLESLGYTVSAQQSSIDAFTLFQKESAEFDLIITDQTMPYMTGDVLAGKCLAARPDIPVILCTGFSEKLSEEKTKELGIKALVMKPVTRAELATIVRKVLDSTAN